MGTSTYPQHCQRARECAWSSLLPGIGGPEQPRRFRPSDYRQTGWRVALPGRRFACCTGPSACTCPRLVHPTSKLRDCGTEITVTKTVLKCLPDHMHQCLPCPATPARHHKSHVTNLACCTFVALQIQGLGARQELQSTHQVILGAIRCSLFHWRRPHPEALGARPMGGSHREPTALAQQLI